MNVKFALVPTAIVGVTHVTVPVAPTPGVVQLNVGPVFWVNETNVVPVGTTSLTERLPLLVSLGPELFTVMS